MNKMKGAEASLQGYSSETVPVEPCTEADYITFKVEIMHMVIQDYPCV